MFLVNLQSVITLIGDNAHSRIPCKYFFKMLPVRSFSCKSNFNIRPLFQDFFEYVCYHTSPFFRDKTPSKNNAKSCIRSAFPRRIPRSFRRRIWIIKNPAFDIWAAETAVPIEKVQINCNMIIAVLKPTQTSQLETVAENLRSEERRVGKEC